MITDVIIEVFNRNQLNISIVVVCYETYKLRNAKMDVFGTFFVYSPGSIVLTTHNGAKLKKNQKIESFSNPLELN